jgi:hypothetical protein
MKVPGRTEPALFAAAALLLYLALAADAFYKVDGIDIVRLLHEGGEHPWHPGYLPALGAFGWLCRGVGLEPGLLQLGAWFSALGAALGVGFARAGMARLELSPVVARLAVAAFALNPGLLTFATVVEFHGPMLAPLGLAFWWTTVQIARPTRWGMALLGALCHLPFLLHGQQLFLPLWLLAFFLARRGLRAAEFGRAALAGGVHAALILVLPRLLPACYGFWADLGAGAAAEGSIGRPQSLDYAGVIFWQEWLLPLLPLSVLVFAALLRRRLWPEFAAFAVGFVPYLYVAVRQLVFEPEYGAYLLPMVLPAAMLTARRFAARRVAWPLLLVGVYVWYQGPLQHLRVQRQQDDYFAIGAASAAATARPYVLVGSHRELGSAFARLDPDDFLWVQPNAFRPREELDPRRLAAVEIYLRQLHGEGRAVLITESAIATLDDPRSARLLEKPSLHVEANATMAGPLLAERLRAAFAFVATDARGFWRLEPR